MRLKRLDIVGFKSFPNRIAVDFVPGVTAVVGPNGSGKSNITDAIRWVLGEQSAKALRGSRMEDIIFSGCETRKPLNFAEVELTLDNEDNYLPTEFQEVTVTRRFYRSGESEFQINKQPCRLKDIIDLFMDTGLGKEAFSIISQGKVEEILSNKPEERRTIFEEAAGVLKYKTRKRRAETKLEDTRKNLERVNDIIHELSSQIEPLRIQSAIAQDYLEKKTELEQVEISYLAYEIGQLSAKWEKLSQQIEEHRAQEVNLSAETTAKEAALEALRVDKLKLDEKITILQDDYTRLSEEYERLEGAKAVRDERIKNAAENIDKLESDIAENHEAIAGFEAQLELNAAEVTKINEEIAALELRLQAKREGTEDVSALESAIEALQTELIEQLNAQATLKHEASLLSAQKDGQTTKSQRLTAEFAKLEAEKQAVATQLEEMNQTLALLAADLEKQISAYQQATEQLQQKKEALQQKTTAKAEALRDLERMISRKEALEALENEHQGFFQGVREVLKERSLSGIEGALAELVRVPKEYNQAIEMAVGAALQNVVVRDESAARAAIAFLKNGRLGRATFLPISVLKSRKLSVNQAAHHASFIGVASDLVAFDEKYREVVENQLGHILIAKDLMGATEISKATERRYRVVTLDGDVVNPGGAMTGGANKQTGSSLLSRKSELEEIVPKIDQQKKIVAERNQEERNLGAEVEALERSLMQLREAGENMRLKETSLNGEMAGLKASDKNIADRMVLYEMDKFAFEEDLFKQENRRQELVQLLAEMEKEIEALQTRLAQLGEEKSSAARSKESAADEMAGLNVQLATKREQLNSAEREAQRLNGERSHLQEKIAALTMGLDALKADLAGDGSGVSELDAQSETKLAEKNAAAEALAKERGLRTDLQMREEDEDHELKELLRQLRGVTMMLHDEEIKLERADADMTNRITKLGEEYHLSFEAACEQYPLTVGPAEAKKKVKLLSIALEELGVVNIGAIDEYERVSERHRFLEEQKADLETASETLLGVISEMDEEMVKRFSETFAQIQVQFNQIFPKLFGGGHAELKLTMPEDLLNTGIDIVAQPPGKKLQHLSLLSGGERALTAIVLLFAILKVRPVPFCILDEVEAALDEANLSRFSSYLREFSQETQFIVITHRKATMEGADVLYGVTMQESGVSRLVSVRLEDKKELAVAAK